MKRIFEDGEIDAGLTVNNAVPPRIYALPKIHKLKAGEDPKEVKGRPVGNTIDGPTSALSRYIGSIIRATIDQTHFNIKNSFDFVKTIKDKTIPDGYVMISFDVVSLFTCMPFSLLMELIAKKWREIAEHTRMSKDIFIEAVNLCANTSFFQLDGKFYKQKVGFPMGGSASSPFADFIMEDCLEVSCKKLPFHLPFIFKYVDDLWLSVPADQVDLTRNVFNLYNPSIQFTSVVEENFRLPYLDVEISGTRTVPSTRIGTKSRWRQAGW